ncbi:hypothetical protein GLOIN_2v1783804 [Rhizophagus clarus]|uniref:Uncharacterized protein n=1 Tax=Rhizophagus clarus TaxID=94130 RepID=A0A8H3QT62_9GLOM|nr:hypothetical protein GLOIN_2v1783804 [Rhizophagus clarus]
MNPIYLIDQFFGSENLQPTPTNLANPELCTNAPYVTSTHSVSIHPSNQHYNMIQLSQPQQNEQTFQSNAVVNSVIVQDNSIVDQSNSVAFFFQPPDDFCNYHVKCWEVSFDLVIQLLNELNTNSSSINFNQNETPPTIPESHELAVGASYLKTMDLKSRDKGPRLRVTLLGE